MSALLPAATPDDTNYPDSGKSEYVVVARRYRPQSFEQLVGQQQVSQALGNAIQTNRVGHAYLFTGARGVGKTSTARIFAKCLNCAAGPTVTPCGECDICQGIASGEDVDVIEIDGASNRGIDEIRQLRSNVNGRPSRARFKIFIIDEVHMLTTPAFNALLKTLEEPPEHVKFIFCTTEVDKIPITVLSRCQRFDFSPIETASIVDRLALICRNEKVEAEPEALQLLARRAAGSMRDSQSLLEQLLSFGGDKLTVDDIHTMLGTAKGSRLLKLVEHLAQHDSAAALAELDSAAHDGVDFGQLIEQLIGLFRDVMAAQVGCGVDLWLHSSPGDGPKLQELGRAFGLETILAVVQILDQSLVRMRQSTHTRTLAEVALVRISKLEDLDAIPQWIAELRGGSTGSAPAPAAAAPARRPLPPPASVPERPAAPPPSSFQKKTVELTAGPDEVEPDLNPQHWQAAKPQSPAPAPAPASPAPAPAARVTPPAAPRTVVPPPHLPQPQSPATDANGPPLDPASVQAAWTEAVAELSIVAGTQASPIPRGPNLIVARFSDSFSKDACERPERRQRLTQALSRILGRTIKLEFELLPTDPGSKGGAANSGPAKPVENKRQRVMRMEKHPLVKQAIELFDAEVLDVIEPKEESEERREEAPGA